MHIPRHATAAVMAACFSTPVAALFAQTPTLAELARQEQERRRTLKAPGRVISEQDLLPFVTPQSPAAPTTRPEAAAPPQREHAASTEANARQAASTDATTRDEAWWRRAMRDARDELRRAELLGSALQSRISALTNDVAARDDPQQRSALADERERAIGELERMATERDRLKKKLADLEEEARRGGIPPGWLR